MRLMKPLFVLAILVFASPAICQTHYCDTTQPTTGTAVAGATVTIQHCNDGKDSTGAVPITPTGFRIYSDGNGAVIAMTKGTTSTVSGKTVYSGTFSAPSAGAHALQTTALVGNVEGPKSGTFTLTTVAAVPSAPTNLTAQ